MAELSNCSRGCMVLNKPKMFTSWPLKKKTHLVYMFSSVTDGKNEVQRRRMEPAQSIPVHKLGDWDEKKSGLDHLLFLPPGMSFVGLSAE